MNKIEFKFRLHLVLSLLLGVRACVCRINGVLGRGPITYDATGRYGVGGHTFTAEDVGAVTIEHDVVTVHLGELG
jgi:hypothetical protein